MTDQKRLFSKETHGADPEQRPASLENVTRNTFRAWCGKTVAGERIETRRGVAPTCWQCQQIWQRIAGKTAAGTQPEPELADVTAAPPGKLSLSQTCAILVSPTCPHCGAQKLYRTVFCRGCYGHLPATLQRRLYRRYGQGFEEAYTESRQYLTAGARGEHIQ